MTITTSSFRIQRRRHSFRLLLSTVLFILLDIIASSSTWYHFRNCNISTSTDCHTNDGRRPIQFQWSNVKFTNVLPTVLAYSTTPYFQRVRSRKKSQRQGLPWDARQLQHLYNERLAAHKDYDSSTNYNHNGSVELRNDTTPSTSTVTASSDTIPIITTTTTTTPPVGVRLNKVFTKRFSRRASDALIADGRIRVNNEIVTDLGRRVVPYNDIVTLDDVLYTQWEQDIAATPTIRIHPNYNTISKKSLEQLTGVPQVSSSSSSSSSSTLLQEKLDNSEERYRAEHIYIKYWKPVGVISTTDRNIPNNLLDSIYSTVSNPTTTARSEYQTQTITSRDETNRHETLQAQEIQKLQMGRRIFNVGRLDKDSSGLLLLTSDGRVPNSVLSKQFVHSKVYHVTVDRPIAYEHLQQLRQGIRITTDTIRQKKHVSFTAKTLPCTIVPLYQEKSLSDTQMFHNEDDDEQYVPTNTIQITLIEGRNRQIRVMLQTVGGYTVLKLHRVQFLSNIDLTNLHGPGDWTYLNSTEVTSVFDAITATTSFSSQTQ
jgi:pseudouridine synthase